MSQFDDSKDLHVLLTEPTSGITPGTGDVGPYVEGYKVADPVRRKSRGVLWASAAVFLIGLVVGGAHIYAADFSPWVTTDAILDSVDIPRSILDASSFDSGIEVISSYAWKALPIIILVGGMLFGLIHFSPMPFIGAMVLSSMFAVIGQVMTSIAESSDNQQASLSLAVEELRLDATRELLDQLQIPSSDKNYVLAQMTLMTARGKPQNGTLGQEVMERIQQMGLDVAQSKLDPSARPILYKMEREIFEEARSPAAQSYESEMRGKQKTLTLISDVALVLGPLAMAVAAGLLQLSSSMRRRAKRIEELFRTVRSRISGTS